MTPIFSAVGTDWTALGMFLAFVAATLVITFYSARKSQGAAAYFAAGRSITGWQNGMAVAGDYMSAASFLGISGMIAVSGYDGFMYSVGWLVAYLTVLLIVAEPLRNAGKYTMADLLAYRLNARPVRAVASLSTLTVSTMYMIAQMVGAGALVGLLLPGVPYEVAVIGVGVLMVVYVVFGGMLATTWVQIIKAVLLVGGSIFLSLLVMQHFNFSLAAFFEAIATVPVRAANGEVMAKNFLTPGMKFHGALGAIDLLSLGVALICGTAALPHILVRFYTVPDAKTARVSVVWAMFIIGAFYIMTTFLGFGAATILTPEKLVWAGKAAPNMAAPLLASHLGGPIFFAFICAVAFATILAVVAGLTISASTSFAHDFFSNVLFVNDKPTPDAEVRVARVMAFIVAAISIWIAIILGPTVNVAFLVGLAFAVAASANLPVIVFTVFWKHLTTAGACAGQITGLVSSVLLVMLSKTGMGAHAIFPLENPGIVSIPLGFLVTWLVSLATREPAAEAKFGELQVRATTGLGAEKAGGH